MVDILLLALLTISLIALIWPFFLYPMILSLLPRRACGKDKAHRASVSLLFCAYNEGAAMPAKIANLEMLKRRHPDLEILAFDDRSSDDTADQLSARPDLVTLVRGAGRSGKAHGTVPDGSEAHLSGTDIGLCAPVSAEENSMDRDYFAVRNPRDGGNHSRVV